MFDSDDDHRGIPAEPDGEDLGRRFRRLIANTGPISLAHYMAESNAVYYGQADPLGVAGDFITAPEISQMFGELIGLWLTDLWLRAGRPEPVHYVELGPGRGTLAQDALRAARPHGLVPKVHFVETSLSLKALQVERHPDAAWHDDLSTVPDSGPLLVVANEFFDALPVRQLVKTPAGWRERMVGLDGDRLVPVAGDRPMDAAVPEGRRDAADGAILETCPAAAAVMYELAGRLAQQGGAALIVDYGHDAPRYAQTLQAVRGHRMIDPFASPGAADLTAHVDFDALARIAQSRGVRWLGTVPQGSFLTALGVDARAAIIARETPSRAGSVAAARERLVSEGQMGVLFKAMGLVGPNWPDGEGF